MELKKHTSYTFGFNDREMFEFKVGKWNVNWKRYKVAQVVASGLIFTNSEAYMTMTDLQIEEYLLNWVQENMGKNQ